MIIPVWQPIGQSSNLIAQNMAGALGVKTSHTGTLDPMAEGILIVLSGDDRLKKYEFAHWLKTYDFEICFGIATDSYDGLGFILQEDDVTNINEEQLEDVLKSFNGEYVQQVPIYSAVRYKGKKLLEHARAKSGEVIELPQKSGLLSGLTLISLEKVSVPTMINVLIAKINRVVGDFRQAETITRWQEYAQLHANKSLYIAKIQVTSTKGLYIRSLVVDICKKLGTVGFAYSITRTKNGQYTKEMC